MKNVLKYGLVVLLLSFLKFNTVFGQTSISTCSGAVEIKKAAKYTMQFPGKGMGSEFEKLPQYTNFSVKNNIWMRFVVPHDGDLIFYALSKNTAMQMLVFKQGVGDVCSDIRNGILKSIDFKKEIKAGYFEPVHVNKNEVYYFVLASNFLDKSFVDVEFQLNGTKDAKANHKIVDYRRNDRSPEIEIHVVDKEKNEPIICGLVIDGSKDLAAFYTGSDFYFSMNKTFKLAIRCSAEGYFFKDTLIPIKTLSDQTIILKLDEIAKGKSFKLENIQFKPGSADFVDGAEEKLIRLKEFMALNATVKVEIQGHVYSSNSDDKFSDQRLSESRARRVVNYLIENGIDKSRLTAVGYGGTKPIFMDPKKEEEQQANRRVEVMVK